MTSILVFFILMGGFAYLKIEQNKKENQLNAEEVEDVGAFSRKYPDGTVEEQDEDGSVSYFIEDRMIKVDSDGTVYIKDAIKTEIIKLPPSNECNSPLGDELDDGFLKNKVSNKIYKEDEDYNEKLKNLVANYDEFTATKLLKEMEQRLILIPSQRLAIYCLENNYSLDLFNKINYKINDYIYEEAALVLIEQKATSLDQLNEASQAFIKKYNHTNWATNEVISLVMEKRRYDWILPVMSKCNDFRTYSERFLMHVYNGDPICLEFLEGVSSTNRALGFFLASHMEHVVIAKSILRSFKPEQRINLKKIFSKLENDREIVLQYFDLIDK